LVRTREPGLRYERLRDEPVMAHLAIDHPLARETTVTLARLAQETILIGSGDASRGYTEHIKTLFAAAGCRPTRCQTRTPTWGSWPRSKDAPSSSEARCKPFGNDRTWPSWRSYPR
jgi:DNA-binding transcriptional LysR family regulator